MLSEGRRVAIFLGNSIFGDDGIALVVGGRLRARLQTTECEVHIAERTGFALLDYLEGYKHAVIVDSVQGDAVTEGDVQEYALRDFKLLKPISPHYAGIPEALELMETLCMGLPRVRIIGISIRDPYALSTTLSDELRIQVDAIAGEVYNLIVTEAPEVHRSSPSVSS